MLEWINIQTEIGNGGFSSEVYADDSRDTSLLDAFCRDMGWKLPVHTALKATINYSKNRAGLTVSTVQLTSLSYSVLIIYELRTDIAIGQIVVAVFIRQHMLTSIFISTA